jgi:hypothetical protein
MEISTLITSTKVYGLYPWVSLALSRSLEVQPPAWLFREPSDLCGFDQNSCSGPVVKFLLSVSLRQLTSVIYCEFCWMFSLRFKIFRLLFIILILEMYSRYLDNVTGNQHRSESINIIRHKICVWFRLCAGFFEAYCHHSRKPYAEPISLNWVREGETVAMGSSNNG